MPEQPGSFPIETETFIATLAQIAATEGDALSVAVLAEAEATINVYDSYHDFGREHLRYALRLCLDAELYGRLGDKRESVAQRLANTANEISAAYDREAALDTVTLAPAMKPMPGWRANAKAWLRGEGINNQGRVRSDNIAARQHDGLLFRSEPEINLYGALKAKGLYVAPLPVFIRGGASYQRLEPDFFLLHEGVVMVVEVDGATVHRESPAEAHARTQGLQQNGVRIERVAASECSTTDGAAKCARQIMLALERYRKLG